MNKAGPALLLGILCLLAGCAGPGYYAQAVAGHLDLMCRRQPVAAVLADRSTGPELHRQLSLAQDIRRFAVDRLGLPDNGSYLHYVATGREAVTWNVVAAPEFSLEPRRWCFPFAGCVPYRGYFDPEDARGLAARLEDQGFDVAVSPALAYSTLGWFRDPLLDTMLRYSDERLAAVIFHEFAHQALYVRGDTAFNESYASFVEDTGVTLWLEDSGRSAKLPGWRERQESMEAFLALLDGVRGTLARIYASDGPAADKRQRKAAAFDALRERYLAVSGTKGPGAAGLEAWFDQGPNNASLALFDSYRGGTCAFASLYDAAGRDFERFQALAADRAALDDRARRAWLEQPCAAVAPGSDL